VLGCSSHADLEGVKTDSTEGALNYTLQQKEVIQVFQAAKSLL
jgi:hypothetical protein